MVSSTDAPGADARSSFSLAAFAAALAVAVMAAMVAVDHGAFWLDDFQSQYLPAYVDVARAVRGGELPLVSPWSWFGGNLAGEYQYGLFSAFLLPLVVLVCGCGLPLWAMAAVLCAVHVAVAAAGCTLLFRRVGAPRSLALGLATGTALGGHLMTTAAPTWFPGLVAFAWLPWLWLALEWVLDRPASIARAVLAGVPLYLILSAGWPFTVAAAGLLLVWFAARSVFQLHSNRAVAAFAITFIVGAALAAPALASLVMTLPSTNRTVHGLSWLMVTPPPALLGFWNPFVLADWRELEGAFQTELSHDLFAGLLMAGAVPTVLLRGRRAVRSVVWELALPLCAVALMMLPSVAPFRWSFRWAPFMLLAFGVVASRGWLVTPTIAGRWPLSAFRAMDPLRGAALVAAAAAIAASVANLAVRFHDHRVWSPLLFAALAGLWLAVDRLIRSDRQRWWAALAFNVVSLYATILFAQLSHYYHMRWPMEEDRSPPAWMQRERTFLSLHPRKIMYAGRLPDPVDRALLRLGNNPMLWGVPFVNGYSPLGPRGLVLMFGMGWSGFVSAPAQEIVSHTRGLLARMAVDFLVVPTTMPLDGQDALEWHEAARGIELKLLERNRTTPKVYAIRRALLVPSFAPMRSLGPEDAAVQIVRPGEVRAGEVGAARVEILRSTRLETVVRVVPEKPDALVILIFAQPYYPGMRAWSGDLQLKVWEADGIMPAVPLPPGPERIVVLSRVSSPLLWSAALAGAAWLMVVVMAFRIWVNRWRARRSAVSAGNAA